MPELSTIIASIEQNGEWFRVHTRPDEGQQYGKKFDTKRGDVAFSAQQLIGQPVVIEYTERVTDKINPKSGRPFVNRYLESVRSGGAQVQTSFTPTQQTTPASTDSAGVRAGRNNIAAAAVETLIQLSDQKPETIQRILDGLAAWSENGIPVFATPALASSSYSGDQDIPF